MSAEITIVQDFMSEDFFASDAKAGSFASFARTLRKEFEDADAASGPEAGKTSSPASPLRAWRGSRGRLQNALLALPGLPVTAEHGQSRESVLANRGAEAVSDVRAFAVSLLSVLGYRLRGNAFTSSPELRVGSSASEAPPLLVVLAAPVDSRDDLLAKDEPTLLLPAALELDDGEVSELPHARILISVSRLLSARFNADDAPGFALVVAGRRLLLTERERWAEGRYIDIDLSLLLERDDTTRGGAVDKFLACAAEPAIAPGADGATWFAEVLEASVKHTESVSDELREAVRISIETIANDVVNRRRRLGYAPLPKDQAQPLAQHSLRYLYRILFLLFAEANPELEIVPSGAIEYEAGYSLDRLRDLALVDVPTKAHGTHLYESLDLLFRLIDQGHNAAGNGSEPESASDTDSLVFHGLQADLFAADATALIDGSRDEPVGLGNAALQEVLRQLLLTQEKKGRARGFISYAELGINQLGRVYEGLMSYTGFFADEPLYEVARKGDPSKGSWVVPVARAESLAEEDFVRVRDPRTEQLRRVRYDQGAFVFRLSGRERQRSASYYTPEVLTRFTVSQALAELITPDTTADEILQMTVCEPALGSGAFALEAVRQLASAYLSRKQDELGERIDPATYGRELQKAKAYIALHNVYGVDLNATAVELAEISLWLDTMMAGLSAPWFGLRLRRGNSLIGAARRVFTRAEVKDHQHLKTFPRALSETTRSSTDIYHFLLPSAGWGAAADSKEGKALAPERVAELKSWRKGVRRKLTAHRSATASASKRKQVEQLAALSAQVDALWETARRRLRIAESETHRSIHVWGQPAPSSGTTVSRAQIEAHLQDPGGAYQRLRRVMDAWCALWFWPLTVEDTASDSETGEQKRITPPTVDEWIAACQDLLGHPEDTAESQQDGERYRQGSFAADASWDELDEAEPNQLRFSGALSIERIMEKHPWLRVAERIAREQGFFHWELEFPTVFEAGGFDLQIGNPPWVRPRTDTEALLAEGDPWWQLAHKPSQASKRAKRESTLQRPGLPRLLLDGDAEIVSQAEFLGHLTTYPHITGTQPDLYRCFMEQTWRHEKPGGVVALIHPESHFTDDKAHALRQAAYRRLRRHWQFVNELQLYDVDHHNTYGVHVYGSVRDTVDFLHATSLYHPTTVERSLVHNGDGPEPGIKDESGRWDLRPHASRIQHVTDETLQTWAAVAGSADTVVGAAKMVYTVSEASASVLEKLAQAPRIASLGPYFSSGWHESADRQKGRFELRWGKPASWDDVILQGPHLHVGNPFFKQPNPTMKHNQDWSSVDLEHLDPGALPVTSYKPIHDGSYDALYTHWRVDGDRVPARSEWRIAWRMMAATTGERTLIPALVPPGAAHPHAVHAMGMPESGASELAIVASMMQSISADLLVRVMPKSTISASIIESLPALHDAAPSVVSALSLRTLRLNCLTDVYADLWEECWDLGFAQDAWTQTQDGRLSTDLGDVGPQWNPRTPLRRAIDRRQALVEIDALVALALGITADELCTVYRTQFPVLYGYDRGLDKKTQYWYDQAGRLVPASVRKTWLADSAAGRATSEADLQADNEQGNVYDYLPPFVLLDREKDMRIAYAEFERRLAAH